MCLGLPGRIVEIVDAGRNLAKAEFNGVRRVINIACVVTPDRPADACVGDWVLVHVGFAMSRIDEAEAARTLALFEELAAAEISATGGG
jgi:hydrogenase expression/formation protein HypC